MYLSILGVLVASITAIYSAIAGDGGWKKKLTLAALALAGFVVVTWAAVDADRTTAISDAKHAAENAILQKKLSSTEQELKAANASLDAQQRLLAYINNSVGQLGKLNEPGGGNSYYVRLAHGKTAEELKKYQDALALRFPGGKAAGLIQVRGTAKPAGFELVFGSKLTLVSAEVFQRMALDQGFANGRPEIRADE